MKFPRGTKDFLPPESIAREKLIEKIRTIFEAFGYDPVWTPALEMLEVLTSKYAGGAEIIKEIYKLQDQGGRWLGLRYDYTVPLARLYSQNPQLGIPFKRYQIGRCWRDGPIKFGRYREFWQCDVDIVGSKSMLADAESLAVVYALFKELELDVIIKVNSRKLLQGMLEFVGVPTNLTMTSMLSFDKLEKIGVDGVTVELEEKGLPQMTIECALNILSYKGTNLEVLEKMKQEVTNKLAQEGIRELQELLTYAEVLKVENVQVDVSLARGLDYYTGNVFEVFLKSGKFSSSLAGGGRYDKLIGKFSSLWRERNTEQRRHIEFPAVGISIGLDTLIDVLEVQGKLESEETVTKVFVIPIRPKSALKGDIGADMLLEAAKVVSRIRAERIPADIDMVGRSISKNLEYANKKNIAFVIFVGLKEYQQNKIRLRDMKSGEEELLTLEQVCKKLHSFLKHE
ncbi:MAG: histidine--tRNA ligase [Candidatus Heimdallarchaeota archaeon]